MNPPPSPEQIQRLKKLLLKKGAEINDKLVQALNGQQVTVSGAFGQGKPGEKPIERLRRFLKIIDDQLARVRAGTYGTCLECGDGLPYAHLEQVPWIDTCQACAQKAADANDLDKKR